MLLKDVFARDPRLAFDSQVSVDGASDFAAELDEYVLTSDAARSLELVLESYASPATPAAVWISGAAGSGKSMFLKLLAHSLGEVCGAQSDRELVTNHLRDLAAGAFLDALLTRVDAIPAASLLLSGDRMVLDSDDRHSDALLRCLMDGFRERCNQSKNLPSKLPDSREGFVSEIEAWLDHQPDEGRLNIFIDDVDHFLGSRVARILELKRIVESLIGNTKGRIGIFVASGEIPPLQVNSVSVRSDLAKVESRFKTQVRLTSGGVAEVVQRRLLKKTEAGAVALSVIYDREFSQIARSFVPSRGASADLGREGFIANYPFLPYQFVLLQEMIGALAHRGLFEAGAPSVVAVIQPALAAIATEPVGRLVAMDQILNGIVASLKLSARFSLEQVVSDLGNPLAVRIARLLFMLNYSDGFRSTAANLTVLVCDRIGQDLPTLTGRVDEALVLLEGRGHIRSHGECYKYCAAVE